MKKPIRISIPTPCHENWAAMTPADKGRFCTLCQKTVLDFTNSSDREIASVLKNTENACGKFRVTQLDRDLIVPKEKSSLWMAASAAVVSFLTIGNHEISAQTPVNTEQHMLETDDIIGKVAPHKIIVTGTVIDSDSIAIPGANVKIKGLKQSVQTDFDGKFSIEANQGEIIEITFVGMYTPEIIITDKKKYNIVMWHDAFPPDITRMIYGDISIHRTFFGRIFHSIGNIFR